MSSSSTMTERPAKSALELTATVLMSVAALLLIVVAVRGLVGPPPPPPSGIPTVAVDLTGAILAGNPRARVAMIEYSDFECPFCGRFARDVAPALWQEYVDSGQVLVAFRHLALEVIHPQALRAAQAAECANRQGQFWAMRDILFRDQGHLDEANLVRAARTIAIDGQTFEACMSTIGPERIRSDGNEARKLGISATPSFLIGLIGEDRRVRVAYRIDGARPLADFQAALRKILAQ
jgi:protein-disulfide isomerase